LRDDEDTSSDDEKSLVPTGSLPALVAASGIDVSNTGSDVVVRDPDDVNPVAEWLELMWSTIGEGDNDTLNVDHLFDVHGERFTLLQFAAYYGQVDDAKRAIRLGANIDFPNAAGSTPLMDACRGNQRDIAELLLKKGASTKGFDDRMRTALHIAVEESEDLVELLVEYGANLEDANVNGDTALLLAVIANKSAAVFFLLESGANPAHLNHSHDDALLAAVRANATAVIPPLLKHGVKLETVDAEGCTALFNAARHGHAGILAQLINHGASVECRSLGGHTPLSIALLNRRCEAANMLIRYSSINPYRLIRGETYLMHAVEAGDAGCVALLLNTWILINHPNPKGVTALMMATRHNRIDIVALLARRVREDLTVTSLIMSPVNFIFNKNLKPDAQCKQGTTALAIAAELGHDEILRMLIGTGATVDLPDSHSATPLHHAIKNDRVSTVELLLQHGANIDLNNAAGETALSLAFNQKMRNSCILDMLLEQSFKQDIEKVKSKVVVSFEPLLKRTCAILLARHAEDEANAKWREHTETLCMRFGLRYTVANSLVDAVRSMPQQWLVSAERNVHPSLAQVRYYTIHVISTLQSFHEQQLEAQPESDEIQMTGLNPAHYQRLKRAAAGQAGGLLACGDKSLQQWKQKVGIFLINLTPETTSAEMVLCLNDELGMHPLLTAHMIDAWNALDTSRSMAQLIRKFSERLAGASFVAELETVAPDTLRSMLLAQMKVLF
jgi:ankyrin repeat protein